jgi:hypothetical protein
MVDQVQVPHSVVADKVPAPGELVEGGLAVNLADYRLYTKGYNGLVIRLSGRVEIKDDVDTDAVVYLTWARGTTGNIPVYTSSQKLRFNPKTGELSAVSFSGSGANLTGLTADQVTGALGFTPVKAARPPDRDCACE